MTPYRRARGADIKNPSNTNRRGTTCRARGAGSTDVNIKHHKNDHNATKNIITNRAGANFRTGTTSRAPTVGNSEKIETTRNFGKTIHNCLSTITGCFKSAVTRRFNTITGNNQYQLWQRNFYEHIIRNQYDLNKIRQYIIDNPKKWNLDRLYRQ